MIRVLSLQIAALGNESYCSALRAAFAERADVEFAARWSNDEASTTARVVDRLLRARIPVPYLRERNLDLYRARADLGYAYKTRALLRRQVARAHYDVLHFHTQTAALLAADVMRRMPSVVTLDQTAFQGTRERLGPRAAHVASERLERGPLRAAARVVAFSQWAARSLVDEHALDPARVRVIPPGIDVAHFAAPRGPRPAGRPARILFVGGDFARKGGPLLVDVFVRRFARSGAELHLVTGERALPEHPQIVVHRDVAPRSDRLRELYASADVFALPTNHDAFGLAFVEAMAAGLPVVGTAVCAVPEIVIPGETGLLVAPGDRAALGDALARILEEPALGRRFGDAAARAARAYDAARNARALGAVFGEAVAESPRTSGPPHALA